VITSSAKTSAKCRQLPRWRRSSVTLDRVVARAKAKMPALAARHHQPRFSPGTRAASESPRALVKTSSAAEARNRNSIRVSTLCARSGASVMATNSRPIKVPLAPAAALKNSLYS